MAATSRGIVASAAFQGRIIAADRNRSLSSSRLSSSVRSRGFVMPTSKSFRAFRTIRKSPRLNRSASRIVMRTSAMQGGSSYMSNNQPRRSFDNLMSKDLQRHDVMRKFDNLDDNDDQGEPAGDEDDSKSAMVDTVNAVLADIVDGQKYIKETGRTKPRPMKRRALVVALALSAFRDPLNDVDSRLGTLRRTPSTSRLARTPSATGFARTAQLMSQLSFGSPRNADMR